MSPTQTFRSGDTIRHLPSGETWWVAWADEHQVICCGWPETIAQPADCELIEAATDERFMQTVELVANSQGGGYRTQRCRAYLDSIHRAECERMMHT